VSAVSSEKSSIEEHLFATFKANSGKGYFDDHSSGLWFMTCPCCIHRSINMMDHFLYTVSAFFSQSCFCNICSHL
jgi:hypothetical protein